MPLNMKEFLPEGDFIEGRSGTKIFVNPDIPEDLIFEFIALKDLKVATKEDLLTIEKMIKKIMLADPRNTVEDVDELFHGLNYVAKLKITTFVGELLSGTIKEITSGKDIRTQKKN